MSKYDYNETDYDSDARRNILFEYIANELAEGNRLKRLELESSGNVHIKYLDDEA